MGIPKTNRFIKLFHFDLKEDFDLAKEKSKKPFYKKWWVWILAIIIIVGIAGGGGGSDDATESDDKDVKSDATAKKDEPAKEEQTDEKDGVLTQEKFDKIKSGMTYEEVVAIVGAEGKVMSESGEKGTEFHTVMYEFETDGFVSAANMTFQGGKLINKSQMGLGGGSGAEITLEQFNQLENGMTLEQVIEIVGGEGEIVSESGEKGTPLHTVMYSYQGKGGMGANVSLMFQGNKLQNKSQFGLE